MSLKFRFLVIFVILSLACNFGAPAQGEDTLPQATAPPPPVRPTATGEVSSLQSTGNTFYVGPSPCDDVGPGSANNPFCSFETALASLQPCDELVLLDGVYTERLVVDALSGTGDAPVTIRGQSPAGVVFDGGCPSFPCEVGDVPGAWDDETGMVFLVHSQHVVLRDITVQNVIAVGVTVEAGNEIWVENVTVRGTGNAGMLFLHTQNLTVASNDVGEVQLGWMDRGDVQVGAHESLSVVGANGFVVRDNYVHDSRKEGIDIKESAANGEVSGNYVERTCLVGIYINEAQEVVVRENRVKRAGYFLNAAGQEDICEHEPVFGSLYGRYYGGGIQLAVGDLGELSTGFLSGITLLRNVVWDVVGNGIEFWDELEESRRGDGMMTDIQVYHNVVYQTTFAGIRLDDAENVMVANNILAMNQESPFSGNSVETNTITHNLFYPGEGAVGDNALTGDPLFLDPAEGDFRLQAGGPAIDAGTEVGLPFAGNAPDLGAFEFEGEIQETEEDLRPLALSEVRYWAYQIQDVAAPGAVDALANSSYDMLVIEPTRTDWSSDDKYFDTPAAVDQLKNSLASDSVHRKLVIAYIDIGEAEDWRWYWTWSTDWDCTGLPPADWPEYILICDPDGWGGNYPVAYWDPAWKDLIIYGQHARTHPDRDYTSVIDEVINDGFDGIYLDWVEGFENGVVKQTAQTLGLDPAVEMIAFIQEMRDYAEARHPDFLIIQQNAAALVNGHPELFSVIDAIAQEGVWFDGDATDDWDDPNGYDWVNEEDLTVYYLFHLQPYRDAGLQVFVCEYALSFAEDAYANAYAQGYVPYVTRRSLGQLTTTAPPGMP